MGFAYTLIPLVLVYIPLSQFKLNIEMMRFESFSLNYDSKVSKCEWTLLLHKLQPNVSNPVAELNSISASIPQCLWKQLSNYPQSNFSLNSLPSFLSFMLLNHLHSVSPILIVQLGL